MPMENLGILFGSLARVKLIRHFLMNPEARFTAKELSIRAKLSLSSVRREVLVLKKAGLIKETTVSITSPRGVVRKIAAITLDHSFMSLQGLSTLILSPNTIDHSFLLKKLKAVSKIKVLIIAGILTGDTDSRVDIFLVGKDIDRKKLERAIRDIEAEIGRELVYSAMDIDEFNYRSSMFDKLIADVLDFPHTRLVDTLLLSSRFTR